MPIESIGYTGGTGAHRNGAASGEFDPEQDDRADGACPWASQCDVAAYDIERRISTHRTSQGLVVYYRCYCGSPRVTVMTWALHARLTGA